MTQKNEIKINVFNPDSPEGYNRKELIDFFYRHLDQFGDEWDSIAASADYAMSTDTHKGGSIIEARDDKGKILGAVILNQTHMKGYHPENYLVYIAVHGDARGKGLGRKLMQKASDITQGGIALHVEPDNPAKFLYEKSGYTTKYLEYRLNKK